MRKRGASAWLVETVALVGVCWVVVTLAGCSGGTDASPDHRAIRRTDA